MATQVQNRDQINDALLAAIEAMQNLEDVLDVSERDATSERGIRVSVAIETLEVSHIGRTIDALQSALNVTLMGM